jgi:translation initiation factor IF-3
MKLKLQDVHNYLLKMSAVEFERVALGREKQTSALALEVVKILYEAIKTANELLEDRK